MSKLCGVVGLVAGGFLLWGVKQEWRWLIDPPEDLSPFYTQAFLKSYFGRDAPRKFAKFLGFGLMILGSVFILFG
jgi:hypothetical protein